MICASKSPSSEPDLRLLWTLGIVTALCAAQIAQAQTTRSPRGDKSVVVVQSGGFDHATYRWVGGSFDALKGTPLPGAVDVTWINDDLAKVGGPCGPGCSAFFLASPRIVLGPYPVVMSVDAAGGVFSIYDLQSTILIKSLTSGETLGRLAAPRWCEGLSCDFRETFRAGRYQLSSGSRIAVASYATRPRLRTRPK